MCLLYVVKFPDFFLLFPRKKSKQSWIKWDYESLHAVFKLGKALHWRAGLNSYFRRNMVAFDGILVNIVPKLICRKLNSSGKVPRLDFY